jgi:hypothetical protein
MNSLARLNLPLQPCAEAILDTHWRLTEKYPGLTAMVQRMDTCNQNQIARELTDGAVKSLQHAYRRCRALLCSHCQEARTSEEYADIRAAYDAARAEAKDLWTVLMTFSSRSFPLDETPAQVESALTRWQRLQNRKAFKYATVGYVRGLQLTADHHTCRLQSHTSVVALVQRPHAVPSQGDWLDLWNSSGKAEPGVLSHFAKLTPTDEGTGSEVNTFFRRVGAVAIQPDRLCEVHEGTIVCDSRKLAILHQALRTRRLIYFGGLMSR